jgi:hypothetical protein
VIDDPHAPRRAMVADLTPAERAAAEKMDDPAQHTAARTCSADSVAKPAAAQATEQE